MTTRMNGNFSLLLPSPLEGLNDILFEQKQLLVFAKRDDLIHPELSGNKFRKLKYQLTNSNDKPLLTFGGAFSNHIAATAFYGRVTEQPTIGVIRGEKTTPLNPTLKKASDNGMTLHFISRSAYRQKNQPQFLKALEKRFGAFYLIPEGGANMQGVMGAREVLSEINEPFDYMISAVGTGTTLAGLLVGTKSHQVQIGIPVLKNASYLVPIVSDFIKITDSKINLAKQLDFQTEFHFGGYAKTTSELIRFMQGFYKQHGIKTDPVYSGKSAYALYTLIKRNYFKPGSTVIWYHCGGLQGKRGIEERDGIKIYPTD